jgi:HEAT repeat protein
LPGKKTGLPEWGSPCLSSNLGYHALCRRERYELRWVGVIGPWSFAQPQTYREDFTRLRQVGLAEKEVKGKARLVMSKSMSGSRKKVVDALHGGLERDNSLSRCCAVRALERLNARDKKSRQGLIGLLRDPDPDVRIDAAAALGQLQVTEAVDPLLGNLENDPEGDVRIEAVKALSRIRSKKAVEPLIRCFKADGYPELDQMVDDAEYGACWEVQSQALNALGEIGDQRATEPVMEALEDEDYEDLQESGFRVLAQLNTGKAQEFLLTQLKAGGRLARRRAAQALAALPEMRGKSKNLPRELLNALTNALVDTDRSVRIYAARVLGESRSPLVVVPLTLLLTDADTEVRKEAATVLGKMRGREVVDRLHSLLAEPDPSLKRQIVQVLGDASHPTSLEPLSALLDAEDDDLLYEVVRALGGIGVPGPQEKLAGILANKKVHATVRIQAAWALGRILGNARRAHKQGSQVKTRSESKRRQAGSEAPRPEEVLADTVFDEDERVCYAALSALVEMDPQKAARRLVGLLPENGANKHGQRKPAGVLPEAVTAGAPGKAPEELKDMVAGHSSETSTLASILTSQAQEAGAAVAPPEEPPQDVPGTSVQILAARLLGGTPNPGPQAVKALTEAFEAGETGLRREALLALGRIGDKKALPTVLKGLEAEQREVRLAALEALAGFTNASGIGKRLAALCQDPDPAVRLRAVQALGAGNGPKVEQCLCHALEDENLEVCRAALGALSKQTYNQDCSDRIVDLMFKFSGELRQEAAAALRRLRDFSPVAWLLNTLNNQDQEEFHWICIDALAEMYAGGPTQT